MNHFTLFFKRTLICCLLAAAAGCQLPDEDSLDQFRGDGIGVEFLDWGSIPGSTDAGFVFVADATRPGRVRLQKFKILRADVNLTVYQESPWYDLRNQEVSQQLGLIVNRYLQYPELVFPSYWYGNIGVLVVGVDSNGQQVWGYDQLNVAKGAIAWRLSQLHP